MYSHKSCITWYVIIAISFFIIQERSSYLEYQKLMREIQHLSRLYVAWLFVCAEETKLKSAGNLKVMQDNIAKMQASMAENESKVQELSAQIQELQKKKDQVLYLYFLGKCSWEWSDDQFPNFI